jgi:beta-phosphoglucomutase-like phosphatase (HAD superfamily)
MAPSDSAIASSLPGDLGALIFDMDGLMIDSEPLWWRVEGELAARHGVSWSDDLAKSCIGTGLPNAIRTMQKEGLPVAVDDGVRWLIDGFIEHVGDLTLKPGCREILAAGRTASLRIALASSAPDRLIDAVLDRFELRACFDAVLSGERVARPKPAPDIFLRAAELVGVVPASCVVLEDSLAGVTAACAAAIAVIAVPELERDAFVSLTPYVVADLHEARALLRI